MATEQNKTSILWKARILCHLLECGWNSHKILRNIPFRNILCEFLRNCRLADEIKQIVFLIIKTTAALVDINFVARGTCNSLFVYQDDRLMVARFHINDDNATNVLSSNIPMPIKADRKIIIWFARAIRNSSLVLYRYCYCSFPLNFPRISPDSNMIELYYVYE